MDYTQIIKDARDPNSKDNTLRLFWDRYRQTANHIADRNILCFPMKMLEANVNRIAVLVRDVRMAKSEDERDTAAKECLELIEKSRATMDELLKL